MAAIVSVRDVRKVYESGFEALKGVSLDIERGEILALLGPNGAGKTTLISLICGIARLGEGAITVGGHDIVTAYREARSMIGLVPQEVNVEPFETVWNTVTFTRGLFGLPRDDAHVERVLRDLSLWDKRDAATRELSGGMKRRVLIAKALAHDPKVLFLDEPTAGVDVELRKGMWQIVRQLKAAGTTIILTTHYIEEAEAIADRVAVINEGRIVLVEDRDRLIHQMGRKELTVELKAPLAAVPEALSSYGLALSEDGRSLRYAYDRAAERTGIVSLLRDLSDAGLALRDLRTRESSLEDIFVDLVRKPA
ncbi:MAG TPA: ABC transporter ATP-binding protein [Amaricoccus sp.]|uniref:ABC transporter ATP-binding protein n=1 Tax=Amaricoccus sp. TaxID=1872485 RepID=UPI002CF1B648|nr:ABC transporter ATP-binding protein [Amaricoccus sp.]HMQ94753.1 ABC transporter ATP-binding protein [Amaricoccus sp.]HMR51333.1 ABC transporter ATP-binding protein [Amaricoccus sp.]HMR60715.1 ABC transporter ATP-binding protein [Amaricoccus sp.]HMT98223.1 ABC transporter ATP-binding protein [Amaricoccus sp.]